MSVRLLAYDVVDVFAEEPFSGNQLAVVHGAADLPDEALAALAREFNVAETTFPTPLDAGRYRTRIFTPTEELAFAGHPTLGTAWVLRDRGLLGSGEVIQECGAGEIGVRLDGDRVELSARPRDLVGPVEPSAAGAVLAALGLTEEDLVGDAWIAGTGLSFLYLPVAEDAVARAVVASGTVRDIAELPGTLDLLIGIDLYAVASTGGLVEVHSRVFVPGPVPEDPATGSAAAGLGLALHAGGLLEGGGRYLIRQGVEMGRPSRLDGTVEVDGDTPTRVRVAGAVQPIARGEIRAP